ncbi:MAG TPA: hypothetical protein VFA61_09185 [Candidatus Udaeobacter sp.]|nr:hypothetical protein [Candidatus Udaeobacter sp.]
MEWLNFHHLRYFWMVACKGGVRKSSERIPRFATVNQCTVTASGRIARSKNSSAAVEVCSSDGRGFTVVHTVIDRVELKHYNLQVIAKVE